MVDPAISLPFTFNEFGEVGYSTDPRKIWQDRVYTAILTPVRERIMRPGYGTTIQSAAFENAETAAEICTTAIGTAFADYLPDLNLIEITPFYNDETGGLEVTVNYGLPTGEEDAVQLRISVLSRSGDILQEIYNG